MKKQKTKKTINHYFQPIIIAVAALAVTGCKSIDKTPFQGLSTAGDKMVQGTKDTYTGVQAILREKQVAYLVGQTNPPWFGDNQKVLFNPNLVAPEIIELRVKMAEALGVYAKKLANLADGPDYQKFDASTKAVADSLARLGTNELVKLKFPGGAPTVAQAEAAANIVDDVAHLLLEQISKHQLKNYIINNESKIDAFTELLAADIGYGTDPKGRPTDCIRAIYFSKLNDQLELIASNTNKWQSGMDVRTEVVNKSLDLASTMERQDTSLVALQNAYKQFAVANHQLIKVVTDSESFDASQAIEVLNGMVDHVTALTKSLK